jgi:ABC-type sugar transport system ATPase subunit
VVSDPAAPAVRLTHIVKRFPGVVALDDVSVEVRAGSCHALCGENGAGKSTLGKIVGGVYAPDSGELEIFGRAARFANPAEALAAGIGMVHQELAFCDNLSVAENLCLESLPRTGLFLSRPQMYRRAAEMLAAIDADIEVRRTVASLSIGQQQMLQIAAAVGRGARVIVFDEPTSSLSQHEAEKLYALIARLREQGVTCIYVSHRMEEIFQLCDTITVLRDGRHVDTRLTRTLDRATLVQMMIGRSLAEYYPQHVGSDTGADILRIEHLSSPPAFTDITFSLRAGEVLGMAGLVGAGRSEIAQAIFGLDSQATGRVLVRGQPLPLGSPIRAMNAGIGLVPEDRKRQGLVLSMSARANTTLAVLRRISSGPFIRHVVERTLALSYVQRLRVRASAIEQPVAGLSGGNQQKVVLAKWLAANCTILILDEPTRGVDVGAKAEIHALIDELASGGNAVLLISSELPEVLSLSTRILVLRNGQIAGELSRADATQEAVMRLMADA